MTRGRWPVADAGRCDAVLNQLAGLSVAEGLSVLARCGALLINNHASLQDEVLRLWQERAASELRCRQMARAAISAARRYR
jgi:hypothetical protein